MTAREIEEYRALRETIRQRGTVRAWLVPAGLAVWAALVILTAALTPWPVASLFPLLVLATTFESAFALHTGVERVGRYLQVFYEDEASARKWEHQAMTYGRRFPGSGPDPLFSIFFFTAGLLNYIPVILAGAVALEHAATGPLHVLFLVRLALARRQAGAQRARDLERFQQLRQSE